MSDIALADTSPIYRQASKADMALKPGDYITWTQIEPDGSETIRHGSIWALAPSVAGMRAYWVLPSDPRANERSRHPAAPDDDQPGVLPIIVVTASRRHRCGRRTGGAFDPKGGRYIEAAERYSESHSRSLTVRPTIAGRIAQPPRAIAVGPLPEGVLSALMRG